MLRLILKWAHFLMYTLGEYQYLIQKAVEKDKAEQCYRARPKGASPRFRNIIGCSQGRRTAMTPHLAEIETVAIAK